MYATSLRDPMSPRRPLLSLYSTSISHNAHPFLGLKGLYGNYHHTSLGNPIMKYLLVIQAAMQNFEVQGVQEKFCAFSQFTATPPSPTSF